MVQALGEMSRAEIIQSWLDDSLPFDLGANDVLVVCGQESADYTVGAIRRTTPAFMSPRAKQHRAFLCVECLPEGVGKLAGTVRAVVSAGYPVSATQWEAAEGARCHVVPSLNGFVREEEPAILGHVLELCGVASELSFAKMHGE